MSVQGTYTIRRDNSRRVKNFQGLQEAASRHHRRSRKQETMHIKDIKEQCKDRCDRSSVSQIVMTFLSTDSFSYAYQFVDQSESPYYIHTCTRQRIFHRILVDLHGNNNSDMRELDRHGVQGLPGQTHVIDEHGKTTSHLDTIPRRPLETVTRQNEVHDSTRYQLGEV